MTIYSLDVLLSWFGTVLFFHVPFNCCFPTCILISQEAGQVVWYSYLFKNFSDFVLVLTVKGIGIVIKALVEVFLELSCFFNDPTDVGNLIFGSSVFSELSLNIWNFTVPALLKPGLENFERYFAILGDECNCAVAKMQSYNCFSLAIFNILSLCLNFASLISLCPGLFLRGFFLFWTLCITWTDWLFPFACGGNFQL